MARRKPGGKRPKTAGTGPRPSASAMQHASQNARFKRGTAKPTKKIGQLKQGFNIRDYQKAGGGTTKPRPTTAGQRQGGTPKPPTPTTGGTSTTTRKSTSQAGVNPVRHGAPTPNKAAGPGKGSSGVTGPRLAQPMGVTQRASRTPTPNKAAGPGKGSSGVTGPRLGAPSTIPGSAGTNTGAIGAPKRLGAPTQVTGNGPRKVPGRPVSGYQPNPTFRSRGLPTGIRPGSGASVPPSGVSGQVKKKGGQTTRPGRPKSIVQGGVHTTAGRRY